MGVLHYGSVVVPMVTSCTTRGSTVHAAPRRCATAVPCTFRRDSRSRSKIRAIVPHSERTIAISLRGQVRYGSELISNHSASFTPVNGDSRPSLGDQYNWLPSATDFARELDISPSRSCLRAVARLRWLVGVQGHETRARNGSVSSTGPGRGRFLSEFVNTEMDNLRYLLGQETSLRGSSDHRGPDQVWLLGTRDPASHYHDASFLSITRPGVRLLSGDVRPHPSSSLTWLRQAAW